MLFWWLLHYNVVSFLHILLYIVDSLEVSCGEAGDGCIGRVLCGGQYPKTWLHMVSSC